jgi:nicotinamidase-related amidase
VSVSGSSTALLVIDMQNDVLVGCADGPGVIDRINELSRRAREAGAPVIFIQHQGEDELFHGTAGWELVDELERDEQSLIVAKTYRDAFADSELRDLLTRLGVTRVVVTGAHSDFCVQTSALSALANGFDLVVVADGHTTVPAPENPALTSEAVTTFINARFAGLRHPGRSVEVLPAAEVEFHPAAESETRIADGRMSAR